MEHDSSITVNHSNLNYGFGNFQTRYKNLCQNISNAEVKELVNSIKKVNSFIFEHLYFVESKELRDIFTSRLEKLKNEVFEDSEYQTLCARKDKSSSNKITLNEKYYSYIVRLLKLVGLFGDELSKTFMPNISDRTKIIRYSNNNSFFEQFTLYKSITAEKLSEFSISKFKSSYTNFLGFYFAYYLFIDVKSRSLCEGIFSNVLNVYLNRTVSNLIMTRPNDLTSENRLELKKLDYKLHEGLNHIFFRCNYSYSSYNILPKVEKKLLVDRTAI